MDTSKLTYNKMTREQWLMSATEKLRFLVFKDDIVPDNVRVSVGLCDEALAVCCNAEYSEDNCYEVFIDPRTDDPVEVLDHLTHELIHTILGNNRGHGEEFHRIATKVGLVFPTTQKGYTEAGATLKPTLQAIADELGEYPHHKWVRPKRVVIRDPNEQFITKWCIAGGEDNPHIEVKLKSKYWDKYPGLVTTCPECGALLVEKPKEE